MEKSKLKTLSDKQLAKREKNLEILLGIFLMILIVIFYPMLLDYVDGRPIKWLMLTISLCGIIAPLTLYEQLREVQAEIVRRQ